MSNKLYVPVGLLELDELIENSPGAEELIPTKSKHFETWEVYIDDVVDFELQVPAIDDFGFDFELLIEIAIECAEDDHPEKRVVNLYFNENKKIVKLYMAKRRGKKE